MQKMATKVFSKPKLLSEFLGICRKNKYFAATVENNLIRDVKFLDHSPNLQANIERQWLFKSEEIENSLKTYNNDEFSEYGENLSLLEKHSVVRKRDRLARSIPFGLIEIENHDKPMIVGGGSTEDKTIGIQLENSPKLLTCWYLVNDKQSQEYFYRIQRLRKIWWMKYAANPGRFVISEVKQDDEKDTKSVSIKATYPFGTIDIESIEVKPLDLSESSTEPKTKTSAPTKVIKTTTVSEVAVIETVLDSIDAGDFGEMCLHRKIAPYQCTVYSISTDPSISNELKDLSKYVSLLLEQSHISILNSDGCQLSDKSALEQKCNEMDAIGVPYGIILDEDSLKTGFMKLRNRDTTLAETIHISYLKDYLPQIFQA
ncbi:DNA polymerase subunit gamma-2, mitochondrial [Sitodiplosis mosellana]|uniref:DNA polymerase subunit gamma-2, mitochondrial n=1 Tax=Sitodiplosis mosellana TaxID=263140 RepID=UPI0024437DA6|nr:DNA polymerase subunit gamma-2, mitochondrial [Sitodiplosis mosellana]